ncbi:phosphoenolpyruvate--protein phosphotransferase [Granulosicoccus antarcticus]|uniref:Phosphoenolpyruvate-protein phosphotransferase n=1 Tax=Granulosicoccus antarcticus IMCC3135 TaxID=1192854 RepID=A0A2Z2NX51_9GAMM|nr:phosphoenolpyruvate--protein phosphotransferase [Granulosicoccus antarcticus]ASJ75929.1 Phosphoenolpyruvate-protein phosphotransferase [Granulosicoccus antarcticus IMCC3135]
MSLMFNGIGVSRGTAIGQAYLLRRNQIDVASRTLQKDTIPAEVRRFKRAVKMARAQLLTARDNIPKDAPSDVSSFLETHILMLDDAVLSQRPVEIIKTEMINAEAALQQQREELIKVFGSMDDSYLATRIDDVNHVIDSVLRALDGGTEHVLGSEQWKGQIIVADDLTPADTVTMQHHGVAGFVTETGGQLSHTAILARSLGIPAIVGVPNIRRYIKTGEVITLDGRLGMVLAEPTEEMLTDFRRQQKDNRLRLRELAKLLDTEAITTDGVKIRLSANIEIEEDLKALKRVNADGVGLYRTEFLYMNRETVPSEQDHFKVYTKVVRALKGAPLTIRTADLGADKQATGQLASRTRPQAHNPAMGLRGIRLCLSDTSLFIPQLRAILRASARGPIKMLLPMLTTVAEIKQCLKLVEQVKQSLREENIEFDEKMPIGGMIEVPAAAIEAERFAKHLDFLSIGTNDLIQYTLAIDRIDDQVDYLYDPLHPAVLTLIKMTIDAGLKSGIPVAMCGEMAGDARFVRLLLGLGLTEFSMPPNLILETKRNLITCRRATLKKQVSTMLAAHTCEERQVLLDKINASAPEN